ncbi:MAG: zf-HC2 domain-containing protein [Candidatus Marinimicrobia bacterium]|nr:zf-HC2 domain-containing protein [Candidatus Neomarinimicrobiota bacterium]
MKHEKWIRNIHLLRKGELLPDEQQALDTHLTECDHCSSVYDHAQLDWIRVMGESATEPVMPNAEQLGDNILSAIRNNDLQSSHQGKTAQIEKEAIFFMPGFRLGLQVMTLVLLAIFFIEQFQVTNSIQGLEVQLQSQNIQPRYARLNMIPPTIKRQLLVLVRGQLEKRGMPSKRIELIVHSLETGSFDNKTLTTRKRDLTRVEKWISGQWGIARFKDVNTHWRQP